MPRLYAVTYRAHSGGYVASQPKYVVADDITYIPGAIGIPRLEIVEVKEVAEYVSVAQHVTEELYRKIEAQRRQHSD